MTGTTLPAPATQVHFLESGFSFTSTENAATGHVSRRGLVITVTTALIEASKDRNGDSWLALVGDPDAQVKRWGKIMMGTGPWPESEGLWLKGSPEAEIERERRRTIAHALPDEQDRTKALRALYVEFGHADTGQRSTNLPQREA